MPIKNAIKNKADSQLFCTNKLGISPLSNGIDFAF